MKPVIMTLAALVLLLQGLPASAATGQKNMRCAEGICYSVDDPPPKPDTLPAKKHPSPGLGQGVMDVPSSQTARPDARRVAISEARRTAGNCRIERQALINYDRGQARRTHDPALDGTKCIQLEEREGNYGRGFRNVCDFTVVFEFCAYRPKPGSYAEAFDCENAGGTEILLPKRRTAAPTAGAEWIYWAGCRHPEGSLADLRFTRGVGYEYRCHAWGSSEQAEQRFEASREECVAEEQLTDALQKEAVEQAERDRLAAIEAERQRQAKLEQERQQRLAVQQNAATQPSASPPTKANQPSAPNPSACSANSAQDLADLYSACASVIAAFRNKLDVDNYVKDMVNPAYCKRETIGQYEQLSAHWVALGAHVNMRSGTDEPLGYCLMQRRIQQLKRMGLE